MRNRPIILRKNTISIELSSLLKSLDKAVVTDVKVMRGSKNITDNYKFGTHIKGTLTVATAPQIVNITENLYVKVGETLTITKIKELLASNIANYEINYVSGSAGTFDGTTGFTAGTTAGTVTMEVVVPAKDIDGGLPEYAEAKKTFYINVVDKEAFASKF